VCAITATTDGGYLIGLLPACLRLRCPTPRGTRGLVRGSRDCAGRFRPDNARGVWHFVWLVSSVEGRAVMLSRWQPAGSRE